MFLHAKNIIADSLLSGIEPWDFKPTENLTQQIRHVKEDRQNWYRTPSTSHYFYTGIEPLNPNLRVNKENNPPHIIYAFVADYDIVCPMARILEAVAAMKIKPSWIEISLSGHFRLVWILETPIRCQSFDFCTFLLQKSKGWLSLSLLPALDEQAYESATRLYCNGCEWHSTGHGPVKSSDINLFLLECGKEFRFKGGDSENVPLDVVEKALKEKFASFEWPEAFDLNTQGPSFWVQGSTSPLSAVVKPGGMYTYAAHAEKRFYSWADLLGADFVKDFLSVAYTKAIEDCWCDGHDYWRKRGGKYRPESESNFRLYLEVTCKLSNKPGQDGISPMKNAIMHVREHNDIKNAGPFVLRKPGPIIIMGHRRLNTYAHKPQDPASGEQKWGPHGNFPFYSAFLDALFNPREQQLEYFLAWWSYFYTSAFNWTAQPGHRIVLCGGKGCGKNLLNRWSVGVSVGGFTDASAYLVDGAHFNSHLLEVPHWVVDDEYGANNSNALRRASAMFKKLVANQEVLCNTKFQISDMVEWNGRFGMTTNLDFTSMRYVAGSLDDNSMDKLCLFRCVDEPSIEFPSRIELMKTLDRERPYLLRYLLDWKWPDFIQKHNRFGFKPYHNEFLVDRSLQGSPVAPFKEIVIDTLRQLFADNPDKTEYSCTVTQLIRLINTNGLNTELMRGHKVEQINRYLEQIQTDRLLDCSSNSGPDKTRVWTFQRIELPPEQQPSNSPGVSFEKPARQLPPEVK